MTIFDAFSGQLCFSLSTYWALLCHNTCASCIDSIVYSKFSVYAGVSQVCEENNLRTYSSELKENCASLKIKWEFWVKFDISLTIFRGLWITVFIKCACSSQEIKVLKTFQKSYIHTVYFISNWHGNSQQIFMLPPRRGASESVWKREKVKLPW